MTGDDWERIKVTKAHEIGACGATRMLREYQHFPNFETDFPVDADSS